jgi:pyruvate,water dikinase
MEEIERYGADPLMIFYAARHNLERAYNTLLGMAGSSKPIDRIQMINNTLSDLQGLSELSLTHELLALANIARQQPSILKWLGSDQDQFEDWSRHWADHEFGHRLHQFMANYGHWATGEGEMANPRWFEQPSVLFKGILACAERNAKQPAHIPSAGAVQQLLNTLDPQQRKAAEQILGQIRQLSVLQSRAMNAFAYILAGTRIWAKAAGHEATEDLRLSAPEDSFFFELEELKQMMTGEWNVTHTAEIREVATKRRASYAEWQQAQPGDLIFDDAEAYPTHRGLPGVVGEATGPLRRHQGLQPLVCNQAVVGARQFDSGWTPSLPVAGGLLAAAGSPLDPIVAAARIWHVPTVVALGPHYNGLVDGAQTHLDGGRGSVEQ